MLKLCKVMVVMTVVMFEIVMVVKTVIVAL